MAPERYLETGESEEGEPRPPATIADEEQSAGGVFGNVTKRATADEDDEEADGAASCAGARAPSSSSSSSANGRPVVGIVAEIRDGWELTWPIWHMLPRHERKELALQHGCKTIGEFEEYMSLQRAVGETASTLTTTATTVSPSSLDSAEGTKNPAPVWRRASSKSSRLKARPYDKPDSRQTSVDGSSKPEEMEECENETDDDENDDDEDQFDAAQRASSPSDAAALSNNELVDRGGALLLLPEDTLHRVFDFLPVDAYATLALVSPHWKPFTRTESAYKRLCERLYLNQSKRRALHVSRFGNSYRTMLERRPRVRAGGGVYVLKYSRVQPIQRDMWTEVPLGAVLEHVYYRYLYFQENGRVLYALTTAPPHDMFRRFRKVCLTGEPDDSATWGQYEVHKRKVTVVARQPWQHVKLELTIQPGTDHGRYGILSFDAHVTNTSGNFDNSGPGGWCPNQVVYEVPEEPFRFVRDVRL